MQHAYAVTNHAFGRPASSLSWLGVASAGLVHLTDGQQDRRATLQSIVSGPEHFGELSIDLGSPKPVDTVALLNANFGALPAFTEIGVHAGAAPGSESYLAGFLPVSSRDARNRQVLQFMGTTARYWKVSFRAPAAWTLRLGEVFMGERVGLSRATVAIGPTRSIGYKTRVAESDSGRVFAHFFSGPQERRDLVWRDLSPDELGELEDMHAAALGGARPILWLDEWVDPNGLSTSNFGGQRGCLYGKFLEPDLTWTEADHLLAGEVRLTLREASRGIGGGA